MKAYNDSLNVAFAASEKVKAKVTFESFATGSGKTALKGAIENIGTVPTKGTLKLQFVNLSGAPVATQNVDFSLAPKEKMPFALTAAGEGIIGYRYDPIP